MVSKKGGHSSIKEGVIALKGNELTEKVDPKKQKKRKEEKNIDDEKVDKPGERKKKRKMLDKGNHGVETRENESKPTPKLTTSLVNMEEDGGGMNVRSNQPVFHIDVFDDLASANASKREMAAGRLAVELKEVQKAFEKGDNKEANQGEFKEEANKNDGLDDCAQAVRYAVRRLVCGVSSSRECARQGFALGLTILLSSNPKISLGSVLKLVDDLLEVTSSMKGQEARDVLLGRLFAFGALARSGRLKEEWVSNRNTPLVKEFTSILISLASKKRYLQEPAVAVLCDLTEMLPKEAVLNHILDAPGIQEWFNGATDSGNPDALLLALRIREKIAVDTIIFGPLLPSPFSSNGFFTVEHLTSISICLKESTFCQPRVHCIWPILVNVLLPDTVLQDVPSFNSIKKRKKSRRSSCSDGDIAKNLKCFSEIVLDESLLKGSHDRKHLVFDILLLMLPRLPAFYVPTVLSLKFVQCLMDVLATKDSWLHKVANNFLTKLSDWVGSDDIRRAFVISALQKHSAGRFDCITRTKTVKGLMAAFTTESGCKLFIKKLIKLFLDEDPILDEPEDPNSTISDESEMVSVKSGKSVALKNWIVESLSAFLKYLPLENEAKVRVMKQVIKFLAVQGLFSATAGKKVGSFELEETFTWPKNPISCAFSKKCVEQLQLLLCSAQKAEDSHALTNDFDTIGCYFMRFIGTIYTIPSVSLVQSLSSEDETAFKALLDTESRIFREERKLGYGPCGLDVNKVRACRYMIIQLVLQLLLRPGEFTEAASELIICCRKAFAFDDSPESSRQAESGDGDSPEVMDVFVDTLLSLLPQTSAPLRSAAEQVFRCFSKDITDGGLMLMLRVIKKDLKPPRHNHAEDHDHDNDDDDDLLDIEEIEDVNEAGETDASDQEVSDVNADSDNDDDDGDRHDVDDDEAMFLLDSKIAKIFQERKNKAGGNSAHAQLVLFKLRVLSLVEIYLHENPDSSRVLTTYSNLVQAFVNPSISEGSEQLSRRIWGILQRKIFKAKDYPKDETVELSTLEILLEKSLRLASRPFKNKRSSNQKKQTFSWNRYKTLISLGQQSTHWILKLIGGRKFPESQLGKVFNIFKATIENFFNNKNSQLKPEFVKELIKRRPWIGQHLFGFFLEKSQETKSDYRRVEGLDLVQEILKYNASKKMLKPHLSSLGNLVQQLAAHVPEKKSRRSEVRKLTGKIFQMVSNYNLSNSFLKTLQPNARAVCESQFQEAFLALKKTKK